jgi:hypothetical protein
MMSLAWLRRDSFHPTDLDLRTFEALAQTPNGLRIDGAYLAGLRELDAVPGVPSTPGLIASQREAGVLADLPFLNTGRGGSIDIDVAPPDEASLVLTVDTGATDTILTDDYARAMGISVRAAKTDPYRRSTVTGTPLVFWVMGQRVVGRGRGPTHFNYALLGTEFLEHYVVDLDFERRRVRFLDPDVHRVGDRLGEVVVELSMRERRPYVRLELGNGSVWALVDTGAETPIATTEEKARDLGIEIDRSAARRGHVNVLGSSARTGDAHESPVPDLAQRRVAGARLPLASGRDNHRHRDPRELSRPLRLPPCEAGPDSSRRGRTLRREQAWRTRPARGTQSKIRSPVAKSSQTTRPAR